MAHSIILQLTFLKKGVVQVGYHIQSHSNKCGSSGVPHSKSKKRCGSSGVRTHASEETRTWVERLRPLGHWTTSLYVSQKVELKTTTPAGFEPARAKPSRFRICLLNLSDKVPSHDYLLSRTILLFCNLKVVFQEQVSGNWNIHSMTQFTQPASMAQLVERSAVNRQVLGSIPSGGAFFRFSFCLKF